MMRRRSIVVQVFLAILLVALISVLITGLLTRGLLDEAFRTYLGHDSTTTMMRGPGMGRMMGVHEEAFLTDASRGIVLAAGMAVLLAAGAALILARSLSRPLSRLTKGALALADGDLEHRVEVEGPEEVVRLGSAFNEMADSLSDAESLRRRLVADVAHELRNPIAALRAQAEGMAEGVLIPDQSRLESVLEDLRQLSRLVDDLQELSVAEAGRLHYSLGQMDLVLLIEKEIDRARSNVTSGVSIDADLGGQLVVVADELRIGQVLRNLLSNAVRHTDKGSITIECRREATGVRVEVRDTGEGISAEDLPFIFERFWRADAARARETGGSGVGLAIARRIMQDHGGQLYATSERGVGTTVGFILPDVSSASPLS